MSLIKCISFLLLVSFTTPSYSQILISNKGDTLNSSHINKEPDGSHFLTDQINYTRYVDTVHKFSIRLPSWMEIVHTGNGRFFMGKFPEVNNDRNVASITSYNPSTYQSFEAFEKEQVLKYEEGDNMYGKENIQIVDRKEVRARKRKDQKKVSAYKLDIIHTNDLIVSQWVLIETANSFLKITFSSTEDTYKKNLRKFKKFVKSFEVIS